MLKKTLLLLSFCYPFLINGQHKTPYIKIYAYQQEAYAGVVQPIAKVNDTVVTTTQSPLIHYLIYIEKKNGDTFHFNKIWIRNKCYSIMPEKIGTPVIQQKNVVIVNQPSADTLVKETNNPVYQLHIGKEKKEKLPGKLKSIIQKNELLLIYTSIRKVYYKTVPEIKIIEPLIRQ